MVHLSEKNITKVYFSLFSLSEWTTSQLPTTIFCSMSTTLYLLRSLAPMRELFLLGRLVFMFLLDLKNVSSYYEDWFSRGLGSARLSEVMDEIHGTSVFCDL